MKKYEAALQNVISELSYHDENGEQAVDCESSIKILRSLVDGNNKFSLKHSQDALDKIKYIVIDDMSDGYNDPKYFIDFHNSTIKLLQELIYERKGE